MNEIKNEALRILNMLAGNPVSHVELAIIIALSLIAAVFVLKVAAKALDFSMADADRAAVCVLVTGAISIIAVAALRIFVLPKIADPRIQIAVIVVALLLIVIAIGMTLCKILLKGGYFMSLAPIIFSIAAAAAISVGSRYTIGAIKEVAKGFSATKNRTESVNKDLK